MKRIINGTAKVTEEFGIYEVHLHENPQSLASDAYRGSIWFDSPQAKGFHGKRVKITIETIGDGAGEPE
ncbi:MAG: hypothetical protein LIP09_00765 [Bacteroidales bacterium]|nr:hypothetical protein [Bacteroidales bacterium]